MSNINLNPWKNFQHDIPASIVVFLVALPLCLGIALASGASMLSGLISGVVGGIVVGLLSDSPLGVSGPAAGLTVIVFSAINQLGDFSVFLAAVLLAGIFQIILGVLKAGFIGYFFPSSVIKGMLSGIGCIIILKQIPHAIGYDKVYEGSLAFSQEDGFNTFSELINILNYISPGPLIISLISLAILIFWETKRVKQFAWSTLIPAPLITVVIGALLSTLFQSFSSLSLQADQLVTVPTLDKISDLPSLVATPDFSSLLRLDVIAIALTIAIVASIETLLCVEATDKLDPYKRVTHTNRELIAQGIGNTLCGFVGGLPLTQVIIRSSSNIQAKAKTKTSAIFHGGWLMFSVLFFPTLLNTIPLSSLAAVLIVVGYKLAKPEIFKNFYKKGAEEFIPFIVTVLGLLLTDLLTGIGMGLAVGLCSILWVNYRTPYYSDPELKHPENGIRIQLAEDVSFLNKAGLLRTLDHLPNNLHVILDASKTRKMHPDIKEIIKAFLINAETRDISVEYIPMPKKPIIDHYTEIQKNAAKKTNNNHEKSHLLQN